MSATITNPVSIKQHLLDRKFEASQSKLEILLVSTNTAGVKDFATLLQFHFSSPRSDGQSGVTKVRKDVELSDVHSLGDAVASVVRIVEHNQPMSTSMKRPYREYSTELAAGLRFGYVKPSDEEGAYFLEAMQDGEEVRVAIGDLDQVSELRYFFTEVQRYG